MATTTIGFRPNAADRRILEAAGPNTSATIRRALRLLDHEQWLEQARADALRLAAENLNDEPDAW
jgi:antitoxin ParD1/3/4